MIKSYLSKNIAVILITLLALLGIRTFFHAGYFPSHDGEWMVIRFSDFHRSLVDGQWPVRWGGRLNFGFGYPVFNFLYPGTFYLAEIFHVLKLNFVDSVKSLFIASYLLSGIFMYLFVKEWFGKAGGFVSAIIYLYTPYRFVDMYVRGSLGESVAFVFPPLIFLAITKLHNLSSKRVIWLEIGALSLLGLITTHNVIAYLFLPLIIAYAIFLHLKQRSRVHNFLLSFFWLLALGLGVSAFFWVPWFWDKQFTIFNQVIIADFKNNFPSILDLIKPSWGYGPSEPGKVNSMSFQLGSMNILIVTGNLMIIIVNIFQHLKKIRKEFANNQKNIFVPIFFTTVTLVAIFFMTRYSQVLWQFIPGLSLIQFPWRMLSVTTFASSFLAGYVIRKVSDNKRLQIMAIILIVFIAIVVNLPYTKPKEFLNRGEGYYFTNDDTTTVQNEYLPIWAKDLPQSRPEKKADVIQGNGIITNLMFKSNTASFVYKGENGLIILNTAFFPGWEAFINNKKQDIVIDKHGLITLPVARGISHIFVEFKETPMRKFADIISLVSLIGMAGTISILLIKRKLL